MLTWLLWLSVVLKKQFLLIVQDYLNRDGSLAGIVQVGQVFINAKQLFGSWPLAEDSQVQDNQEKKH